MTLCDDNNLRFPNMYMEETRGQPFEVMNWIQKSVLSRFSNNFVNRQAFILPSRTVDVGFKLKPINIF